MTSPSKSGARRIDPNADDASPLRYTIATLVNDAGQYAAMCASFRSGGFAGPDCEFLFVDNTGPHQTCAYRGLDAMLDQARGRYVILCHQDVRLLQDDRVALEARLAELDGRDRDWAVAGNAGGIAPGRLAVRITDPHGKDQNVGQLPARVATLDENFLVVRRSARIGFSRDLTGFHFYGADICLNADIAGYSCWVIDFHIQHLSSGRKGVSFAEMEAAFSVKWSHALRARWLQTTCSLLRVDGGTLGQTIGRLAQAPYAKLSRRLPGASGWTRRADT